MKRQSHMLVFMIILSLVFGSAAAQETPAREAESGFEALAGFIAAMFTPAGGASAEGDAMDSAATMDSIEVWVPEGSDSATALFSSTMGGDVVVVGMPGMVFSATGRTADDLWLKATSPDGQEGWLSVFTVEPVNTGDDWMALPIVEDTEAVTASDLVGEDGGETVDSMEVWVPDDADGATALFSSTMGGDVVVVGMPGMTFTAIGRTADDLWLKATSPDGQEGWLSVFTVEPVNEGEVFASLPIVEDTEAVTASDLVGEGSGEMVDSMEVWVPDDADYATALFSSTMGGELLVTGMPGMTFTAIGRTADDLWLKATSPDGQEGWLSVFTVEPKNEGAVFADLPIVEAE